MKPVMPAAALLLALSSFAHAETCIGRVKIDPMNELAGGKIVHVGGCMFLPPALPKQILRSCPAGSYCRVEGVSYSDGEVGPEIEAVSSVTREAPPACAPVPMDGKGWIGVGGWKYASKSCARGPRERPKDQVRNDQDVH